MKDFWAEDDRSVLERHGLASFDALWTHALDTVDEPNQRRRGWSRVSRLALDGRVYYLKRQSNYLTRSRSRPWGEPTFAREFRNIRHYARLGIPALRAAFFGERKQSGDYRAILLTPALPGRDMEHWLQTWSERSPAERQGVLTACAALARRVHDAGQKHGCFYPKHIFLDRHDTGFAARLIDLEKSRPLLLGKHDRLRDLDTLLRRAPAWNRDDRKYLLQAYLGNERQARDWLRWLDRRYRDKAGR